MSFDFLKRVGKKRYGAVVDIGSGSVGVAVVASHEETDRSEVLWSHREYMVVPKKFTHETGMKQISTTTLNAFLELGDAGVRALTWHDPKAQIETVKVSISAPWSYTMTNTVSVEDEKPFTVSKDLINELLDKSEKTAQAALEERTVMEDVGLELITKAVIDVTGNGYHITDPKHQSVKKLTISELRSYTDVELVKVVRSAHEKVLPKSELDMNAFMFTFYQALRDLYPDTTDVCLMDVTNEATEVGVVFAGVLSQITYMPFGSNALAREIVEMCKVPHHEALGLMRANGSDLSRSLSKKRLCELENILGSFDEKLSELLKRTGDQLSIPRTVFLHTDALTEDFFAEHVTNATNRATGAKHSVHPVTSKFFTPEAGQDSAILLSSYVFHKKLDEISYLKH